jgi:hypothetical protein
MTRTKAVALILVALALGAHSCSAFYYFAFHSWMTAQPGLPDGTLPSHDDVALFGRLAVSELERGFLLLVVAGGCLYFAIRLLYRPRGDASSMGDAEVHEIKS